VGESVAPLMVQHDRAARRLSLSRFLSVSVIILRREDGARWRDEARKRGGERKRERERERERERKRERVREGG